MKLTTTLDLLHKSHACGPRYKVLCAALTRILNKEGWQWVADVIAHADAQPVAQEKMVVEKCCSTCKHLEVSIFFEPCGDCRELINWQPKQPVATPSINDFARAVIAHMERPLRIVELSPLDVMEMEELAGIEAAEELDHYTTPLPENGLAYLLGAQIAGEGEVPIMSEKLRPCPNLWCSELNTRMVKQGCTKGNFWVRCMCGVCGPLESTREKAVAAWNQRPVEDALVESLKGIRIYANDTLSGPCDYPADLEWYREAVIELHKRAAAALQKAGRA